MANVRWLSDVIEDAYTAVYAHCTGGTLIAVDLDTGIAYQDTLDRPAPQATFLDEVKDYLEST